MNAFETQTVYSFQPSVVFAEVATPEELAQVQVYPVVNSISGPLLTRKADVLRYTKAGFKVTSISPRVHQVDDQSIGVIVSTEIGPMIIIDRVEEKYSDNNGAYQVAYGRDAQGNEMVESNMYDPCSVFTVGVVK
jgi:hypothetical protein